ncbi:hypothetical protein E2C01_057205 [Portunus trituberculatus]|uniref:Uncharacterized protein n=1 Tax=Portunus trituberculatus TaxID=210409 RepID=A0A5B7GSC9_PORTR|nr:hypothetical protein [Portunus trituberculatus]
MEGALTPTPPTDTQLATQGASANKETRDGWAVAEGGATDQSRWAVHEGDTGAAASQLQLSRAGRVTRCDALAAGRSLWTTNTTTVCSACVCDGKRRAAPLSPGA